METTRSPWHANAIRNGRIIGDATTAGAEKYQINNHNATVATVYRAHDARLIAAAPDLLAALRSILGQCDTFQNNPPEDYEGETGMSAGDYIARIAEEAQDAVARARG